MKKFGLFVLNSQFRLILLLILLICHDNSHDFNDCTLLLCVLIHRYALHIHSNGHECQFCILLSLLKTWILLFIFYVSLKT